MNMNGFDMSWLAAGGLLALIAGFWDKLKQMIHQASKVMIVQVELDLLASMDMVKYIRTHYKWVEFSSFHVRTRMHTRLDEGRNIYVPFKTPEDSGLYHGPHGWVWMKTTEGTATLRAIRGTVDFLQMVKDSTLYDEALRAQHSPQRFYIEKVIGSEKGAWALGEAVQNATRRSGPSSGLSDSAAERPSSSASLGSDVYESIDRSFLYEKSLYTHSALNDPFKGLFYSREALQEVENARKWLGMNKWYADRSIPHRRGVMIHGPGGTGKSSYAKALAETLGIPVYQFFLNTLSDQEFIREWGRMGTPCIALLEDFDNVFHGRVAQTEHKALSFDTVLNLISGVSALNGVYLMVTTNHLDKVDPAMGVVQNGTEGISTRPGRIDRVLYFGEAEEEQRRSIALHILKDWPDAVEQMVVRTEGMTPAQVQEMCTQVAYERLSQ